MSAPPVAGVLLGFLPSAGLVTDAGELYVAIGIVGATVMPHNLFLHSALVQSRAPADGGGVVGGGGGKREASYFMTVDAVVALTVALFVNAAILITAAAAFNATGNADVADLETAYALLAPLLGSAAAPILFAVALLAAGQNSTLTGVMAGQVRRVGWGVGVEGRVLAGPAAAAVCAGAQASGQRWCRRRMRDQLSSAAAAVVVCAGVCVSPSGAQSLRCMPPLAAPQYARVPTHFPLPNHCLAGRHGG